MTACPKCGSAWLYGPLFSRERGMLQYICKNRECGAPLYVQPTPEEAARLPCGSIRKVCNNGRVKGDHLCSDCRKGEQAHGEIR